MKAQSQSSKKDSSNKNVRWLPYFRASEVRCYLQFFQRRFYIRIRVMVQISSSQASSSLVFIDCEVVSFFDFAANCKLSYCSSLFTEPGM